MVGFEIVNDVIKYSQIQIGFTPLQESEGSPSLDLFKNALRNIHEQIESHSISYTTLRLLRDRLEKIHIENKPASISMTSYTDLSTNDLQTQNLHFSSDDEQLIGRCLLDVIAEIARINFMPMRQIEESEISQSYHEKAMQYGLKCLKQLPNHLPLNQDSQQDLQEIRNRLSEFMRVYVSDVLQNHKSKTGKDGWILRKSSLSQFCKEKIYVISRLDKDDVKHMLVHFDMDRQQWQRANYEDGKLYPLRPSFSTIVELVNSCGVGLEDYVPKLSKREIEGYIHSRYINNLRE